MSESPTVSEDRRIGRAGPLIAALWLVFLVNPFVEGLHRRSEVDGVAAMVLTVVFAIVYVQVFMTARRAMRGLGPDVPVVAALTFVASLALMSALIVAFVGESGFATAPFVAVTAVMLLPLRYGGPAALAVVAGVLAYGLTHHSQSVWGSAFGVVAGSLAVFGFKTVLRRNRDLIVAEQDNAKLLVDNERNRFARDLHDILGHSLTVITVKAELANRLFDADPARARGEIMDLERLARDALADVRRAVEGYRDLTLPGEISRARTALEAAEITAVLPNSTDEVPTDLRELFAWTVREGVTNVIRHSAASTCTVRLGPTSAEVVDDGRGTGAGPAGHGLVGLRERADAVGATVTAGPSGNGFSLKVERA
ncbi:sensor histidine kinase [Nocardioides montaniterrae]